MAPQSAPAPSGEPVMKKKGRPQSTIAGPATYVSVKESGLFPSTKYYKATGFPNWAKLNDNEKVRYLQFAKHIPERTEWRKNNAGTPAQKDRVSWVVQTALPDFAWPKAYHLENAKTIGDDGLGRSNRGRKFDFHNKSPAEILLGPIQTHEREWRAHKDLLATNPGFRQSSETERVAMVETLWEITQLLYQKELRRCGLDNVEYFHISPNTKEKALISMKLATKTSSSKKRKLPMLSDAKPVKVARKDAGEGGEDAGEDGEATEARDDNDVGASGSTTKPDQDGHADEDPVNHVGTELNKVSGA